MTFSECASERAHRVSEFTLIRGKHLVFGKKKKEMATEKTTFRQMLLDDFVQVRFSLRLL